MNDQILKNDLLLIENISNKEIINYMRENGSDVVFDITKFSHLNLSKDFLLLLKNHKFLNTNLANISKDYFEKDLTSKSFTSGIGCFAVTRLRYWYEWIILYMRWDFDNELSKNLASGSSTIGDITGIILEVVLAIPGLNLTTPLILALIALVTALGNLIFESNNLGNGVYIRFAYGVVITGIGPSTYDFR